MAQLVKTVQGLAIASVKTTQGLAIASAKTILGVDNTGGGGGTPTFVQDDGSSFDPWGTARSTTFGSSTVSGNMIIVAYGGSNASSLVASDNKGNSYTTVVDGATSGAAIAYAMNITGGASHQVTATVTSNGNAAHMIVLEYSGITTSSAFDQGAQSSGFVANSSVTTGSISQAVELLFGALLYGGTATAGSGFTLRHNQGGLWTEDKNSAATGAQTINFTHAEGSAGISGATFKAS